MLTLNQYNETNRQNQTIINNISFSSMPSVFKTLTSSKDLLTLSEDGKLNSAALKWIKSKFDNTKDLYNACLNSDNNISETALNFLKSEVSNRKPLQRFFKSKDNNTYRSFGDKFLAIMLEASKNNESNHADSNLEFLGAVLKHYESYKPNDYLDVVINSKDADGNINLKTFDVFNAFYSQDGNTEKYFKFMKSLLSLPKSEQDFIFNNFSKQSNSMLFRLLQLAQGSNSEKLINAISEDMDKGIDPEHITECLEASKDVNNEANLYNYQKLQNQVAVYELRSIFGHEIRDKKGIIQDDNVYAVTKFAELFKDIKHNDIDISIKLYSTIARDKDGIIDKNFCDNLIEILSQNKAPYDYENIIECIKLLQNKKGEIQWQYVNYLTSLKRIIDKSTVAKKDGTFKKIINILTDKNGNIIPSFSDYKSAISDMEKADLLPEVPIILNIVQKNGAIDNELYKALKALVLDEPAEMRYETAMKLADLCKNNWLDNDFFTKISEISNLKIKGDKYKILGGLNDSNDKISQVGFDFLVYLVKDCHIKEEEEILSFLKLAKDKSGDFSNDNISYIKDINKIVPKYDISKVYISASKQNTGSIDKNYYNNLIKFLSENEHPEDYENILACIGAAKNKECEIQWKYVNNLYKFKTACDESKMGKEFKTFSKILNSIKSQDGNFVPEFIEVANECLHEKMLYEIPTIISLSKNKDQLNKDNYKRVVKILLKNTATEDRYKMSEYIKEQAEKAGSLDAPNIKMIERLEALNISTNLLEISHFLKNPDGSVSIIGLNLVSDLRKTFHHQIESDLAKILKVSRDRTGYINKKNVEAIKELLHINKNIDATGLVKSTLNEKGEVDSDKYKIIVELITKYKMSDTDTINIINMSKDKKGNIDFGTLKLFVTLAKKGKTPKNYNKILPAYKALYKFEHATSLSQLNLRQKRDLMRALKRYYHSDMQTSQFKEILSSKMFPSDESEYCSVMGRLSHSIGISVKKLPKDVETKYYKAMKVLENPKGDFMNWDFDKNPPVLELKYPLKDFKRDIMDATANYSYSERTKALDYFGFELKKEDGIVRLSGFPNDKPDCRLSSNKDKRVLHLINKLSPYVIEFSANNEVTVKGSKEMSDALTDIIKAFPEFLTTVGKRQHHTHDFSLDVHCLKVLQDVLKNPEYKNLSHTDRKEMQIIALFHDLAKAEGLVDKEHPENSAFNVYYLLNKLDMKEKDKLEIYNVIRNHDWLTNFDFSEYAKKDIAFHMRGGEALNMLLMLTQADLKGVKKHDAYYKMYGNKLKKAGMEIQSYLRDLQRTAINLPQTKIPKASELNCHSDIVDKIHADGITNTVLYLKPNYDLGKAGFKTCRSTDDFNVLVHGLDNKDDAAMFQALSIIDSDALLSTSYILYSKGNYRAFRNEGFVLDVAATNIHAAYWKDFGSGCKKNIKDSLYSTYLFRNNPTRNYISEALRKELNLIDKEYIQLFKEIEDMPIEELEKKHSHIAQAYKQLFKDMEVNKRTYGRNYNEVLVSSPKIQGIFCYGKSPESISVYLRRYAEKNDIPIIVFG